MKLKLPDLSGKVIVIKSDQKEAKKCYENSLKTNRGVVMVVERLPMEETPMEIVPMEEAPAEELPMEEVSAEALPVEEVPAEAIPREEGNVGVSRAESARERRPVPVESLVERQIGGKTFKLGRSLEREERDQVAEVISRHLDAFAWTSSDMPGIDPDFLCHHLTMDPKVRPVCQRRKFNEERRLIIREETKKLLSAGHIREIQYPEWLANVVLEKKANGKWRMWVDFTDLNKVCQRTRTRCRASTRWWTAPRAAKCLTSCTRSLGTIILRYTLAMSVKWRS